MDLLIIIINIYVIYLNINYFRYSNIYEDYMGNFNLDFEIFEPFLTDVINK